jgi:hypothetical protein
MKSTKRTSVLDNPAAISPALPAGGSGEALSLSRPRCRKVLECASPLTLSGRLAVAAGMIENQGVVGGKAAEGCRTPRRWRDQACLLRFVVRMRARC